MAGPNSAGVSSALQFNTASSLPHGPWFLTTANGGPGNHDHPLLATYNCRWNDNSQSYSRVTDGEHCVRIGYESRWTRGDPKTQRGGFEFNIDIDNRLSGNPLFDRRPLFLFYDMDLGNQDSPSATVATLNPTYFPLVSRSPTPLHWSMGAREDSPH